jgi:glycosyltransferase involved in cell wall biosynthesis
MRGMGAMRKSRRLGVPAVEVVEKELHLDLDEQKQELVKQVSLTEPLVIGIDGNEANVVHRVGSNQFAFEVMRAMKEVGSQHEYVVYLKKPPLAHMPKPDNNWRYRVVGPKMLWTQVGLPLELYLGRPRVQVWFTPGHYAPRWSPVPTVVAVMDLAFLKFPQFFRKQDYLQLKAWTERSVKRAVEVVTISSHTKNDVVAEYGVDPEVVTVAHPGYDRKEFSFPQPDAKIRLVREKYGIGENYFLYLGTLQPRKNLVRLVEAFAKVQESGVGIQNSGGSEEEAKILNPTRSISSGQEFEIRNKSEIQNSNNPNKGGEGSEELETRNQQPEASSWQLVIAGKKGWMYEEIFEKVKALKLADQVIFTDFVPEEEVAQLMAGARALVFPALYEGFGIPVVEAMAVGTPGIVANTASLPEIIDHAGMVVDPYSTEEIGEAMKNFIKMSDEEYHRLVDKGLEHSHRHFSWENCAARVLQVLEKVVHGVE